MGDFEILAAKSIPSINAPNGWKKVPISECREPLIALSTLKDSRVIVEPQYFRKGLPGAIEEMYAREGVVQKLVFAASQLPAGYHLLVWDAWRPLSVQQALFDEYYQILQAQFPTLPAEEVRRKTETYVSIPSNHILHPSPHYTGGAIDLTLADRHGRPLPMGTEFDANTLKPRTRSLEELIERGEPLNEEQQMALCNRRVLYHTMIAGGFTNYCEEWWHFDHGNQFWGAVSSKTAFYGPIRSDALGSSAITKPDC
jgi:D-alanyl-D-alanine dipeptidase